MPGKPCTACCCSVFPHLLPLSLLYSLLQSWWIPLPGTRSVLSSLSALAQQLPYPECSSLPSSQFSPRWPNLSVHPSGLSLDVTFPSPKCALGTYFLCQATHLTAWCLPLPVTSLRAAQGAQLWLKINKTSKHKYYLLFFLNHWVVQSIFWKFNQYSWNKQTGR